MLSQFHDVLIGVAVMTAFLGHWVDMGVILGVVLVNGLIGFIQEGKAEQALEASRNMLPHSAVAKEASETVLLDDNFASIGKAVWERRTVYDNLRKAILFILRTNGGRALTIIPAIALGRMLPITPVQILWVNIVTAVTLALSLAFEPPKLGIFRGRRAILGSRSSRCSSGASYSCQ